MLGMAVNRQMRSCPNNPSKGETQIINKQDHSEHSSHFKGIKEGDKMLNDERSECTVGGMIRKRLQSLRK